MSVSRLDANITGNRWMESCLIFRVYSLSLFFISAWMTMIQTEIIVLHEEVSICHGAILKNI